MDQKQIEEIVRSVMASMGQAAPAPSEAKCATTNCAAPVTSESCALDAIAALSRFFGKTAPVFVDNAEGVTALDRIPGQRIRLAVSAADETLRTELEEE